MDRLPPTLRKGGLKCEDCIDDPVCDEVNEGCAANCIYAGRECHLVEYEKKKRHYKNR